MHGPKRKNSQITLEPAGVVETVNVVEPLALHSVQSANATRSQVHRVPQSIAVLSSIYPNIPTLDIFLRNCAVALKSFELGDLDGGLFSLGRSFGALTRFASSEIQTNGPWPSLSVPRYLSNAINEGGSCIELGVRFVMKGKSDLLHSAGQAFQTSVDNLVEAARLLPVRTGHLNLN